MWNCFFFKKKRKFNKFLSFLLSVFSNKKDLYKHKELVYTILMNQLSIVNKIMPY